MKPLRHPENLGAKLVGTITVRNRGGYMLKQLGALLILMAMTPLSARAAGEPGAVVTAVGYELSSYGHRWDVCDVGTTLPRYWLAVPRIVIWNGIYPSTHFVAQAKTLAGDWQDKEYTVGCRSWAPLGARFIPFALVGHDISGFGSLDFLYCPWSRFWLNTGPDTALRARTSGSLMDVGGSLSLTVAEAFSLTLRAGYLILNMAELSKTVSAGSGYSDIHFPKSTTRGVYLGVQLGAGQFQPPPDDVRWHPNEFMLVPMVTPMNRQEQLSHWEAGGKSAQLFAVVEDGEQGIRDSALTALGRVGDALAISGLAAALTNERADVRAFAAYALGKLGPRASAAVPALVQAFPSWTLSRNADDQDYTWKEIDTSFRSDTTGATRREPGTEVSETYAVGAWALQKITGKKLGKEQQAWTEWFKEHGFEQPKK